MRNLYWLGASIFICIQVYSQPATDGIIAALDQTVFPIQNTEPDANFNDIAFLKNSIGKASIVGLGESTHGTWLYDSYRQRLIRFLVQEMNYKAIINEGDLLAAEKLDAYINGQTDTLIIMGNIQPVITNKKELEWLRAYNKNKPEAEKVHIYGAEVRGFYGILDKVKSFSQFTGSDNDVLDKFMGDIGIGYKNLTKNDFENLETIAQKLNTDCTVPTCKYYLSLLNQQLDFAYRQRFGRNDFNVRDNYMFENINAIISKSQEQKAIILAHNGHIQKTKFEKLPSLGYLLNTFYKEKYYTIATDFNTGDVRVFDPKTGSFINKKFDGVADKKAIEYYFKQSKFQNFILPINRALNNPLISTLVNKKIKMVRNMGAGGGAIKTSLRMADNYDLIVFFRETGKQQN